MTSASVFPHGSEWHRWDPHLHAPGTLLNDQFKDDWEAYLTRLEQATPRARALGVTDYLSIRTYRRVREYKRQGRLPDVDFIFPNVEFRMNVETERRRGINLHLLFAPTDPEHELQIERILGLLEYDNRGTTIKCTPADLIRFGKLINPRHNDEGALREGTNQFKVDLDKLKKVFRSESWLQDNCLVAVAAAEGDGTAGLQNDASFKTLREELEAFADIIFSSKSSDRDYWLGKKTNFDSARIEKTYGSLKPCLHGSDAHEVERVLSPDQNRFCWLKAELSFEGLRQAVLEPERRVLIGEQPLTTAQDERIHTVTIQNAAWVQSTTVELNSGLVAIIGSRGSGKTALADIIARGADALRSDAGDSSFLQRASTPVNLLGNARVHVSWGDGDSHERALLPSPTESEPRVRYLSQQFVERLCSANGVGRELLKEIESVVFQAIDETERLGASDFAQLRDLKTVAIRERLTTLQTQIHQLSRDLAAEELTHEQMPTVQRKRKELKERIAAAKKELRTLIPKDKEERATRLSKLDTACQLAESRVQQLNLTRAQLIELKAEVEREKKSGQAARLRELRRRYPHVGFDDTEWKSFELRFAGDVDSVVSTKISTLDTQLTYALDGDPQKPISHPEKHEPSETWPVNFLRSQRELVKKEVASDSAKAQRVAQMSRAIGQLEVSLKNADDQIAYDTGFDERRGVLIQARRNTYAEIFEAFLNEQKVLEQLYSPLRKQLNTAGGNSAKLNFVVRRRIDVTTWVKAGENLLDLRAAGGFRGTGKLEAAVLEKLVPSWTDGGADAVAAAMDQFITAHIKDIRAGRPASVQETKILPWMHDIAWWLFSTEHIQLEYSIIYDGTPIERLSPGTRGIVLLTLYLAIDEWDRRPLLIDQPEENLDPRSIFDELVGFFRTARTRRQLILVTHNANLVVNTDADQVIVAEAARGNANTLPTISYFSGGLEDPTIRKKVCELLEGGERAFLERERRYRLRRRPDQRVG